MHLGQPRPKYDSGVLYEHSVVGRVVRQPTDSALMWAEAVLGSLAQGTKVICLAAFLRQEFINTCLICSCLLVLHIQWGRRLDSIS